MPRVDDTYSIFWWYVTDLSSFFQRIYLYETTDDHHDDHGIQTRIVSRVLLRVGQSTFTLEPFVFNLAHNCQCSFQPTGVKPTSDPTNLSLPMQAPTHLAFQWHHASLSAVPLLTLSYLASSWAYPTYSMNAPGSHPGLTKRVVSAMPHQHSLSVHAPVWW